MFKLFKPYVSYQSIINVVRVLLSDQLAEGPEVEKFENEFENYFNVYNAVAVHSGTAALDIAYEIIGIKENDEVITPVLTCVATNVPLINRKAKIIFADVLIDSFTLDHRDVERKISKNTKAIIFVHFGGNNDQLKEVIEIGRKYHIPIVEDAAQAVGSVFWGRSDFTAISLQAVKTLTSGDGGFLLCKNKGDYDRARRLRWFGYDRALKQKNGDCDITEAGYKYHMNDITAAIGRGNLKNIKKIIDYRKNIASLYISNGICASIWFATALVDNRKEVILLLKGHGIESGIYHYRNDVYSIFGGKRLSLPVMDYIENRYILLPIHHKIPKKIVHRICQLIKPHMVSMDLSNH